MKRIATSFALLSLALAPVATRADGGMWMPQQMVDLAPRLKKLGFQGNPKAFSDLTGMPMDAIVSLGGCSASFVSKDGLIITNHHCVTGALQYNATPERNTVKEGFLAATQADEAWAGPGSRVFVTVAVREVTKDVVGKLAADLTDLERQLAIEKREKELTAACEKEGLRCRIASFFQGLKWFEVAQVELKDVRLVYAPPSSIGNYGGEIDNWRWPRHTGDFAFYRAYVGKDGKPAAFDKSNVPFKPKHFLAVDPAGASPGEVVVVAGYPGRTARHVTAREMKDTIEWSYPRVVQRFGDMLAILAEQSKGSKETEIRIAQRVRGLANSMKNRQGVLEGAKKGKLLEKKSAAEAELQAWIDADPSRKAKYGGVIAALEDIQARREAVRERDAILQELYTSSSLLGSARTLRRLAEERQKPDADREAEFQQRNWERLRESQERLQRTIDLGADRALLRYTLLGVAKLPQAQRIQALDVLVGLTAGPVGGRIDGQDRRLARHPLRNALQDRRPEVAPGALRREAGGGPRREGSLPRPGHRAGPARQGDPGRRKDACRRDLPARPGLHAGHAREGRRTRGPGRQLHPPRDLRDGEGGLAAGRRPLPAPDHAPGRGGQGPSRRQGLRRSARAPRRGGEGPRHRQGAVRGPEAG